MKDHDLTPLMKGESVLLEAANAPRRKRPWWLLAGLLVLAAGAGVLVASGSREVALALLISGGLLAFAGLIILARPKIVTQSLILTNERLVFTSEQGTSTACALDAVALVSAKGESLTVMTAGGSLKIRHLASARLFMTRLQEEMLGTGEEETVPLHSDVIVHNPLEDLMEEDQEKPVKLEPRTSHARNALPDKDTSSPRKPVTLDLSKAKKESNASLDARQIIEDKLAAKKALEEANAEHRS